MKRFIAISVSVVAMLLSMAAAYAQEEQASLTEFLESYKEKEGVEYMNLKGLMLRFAKPAMKDTPMKDMVDNIDNMSIFSIEPEPAEQFKQFCKDLTPLLSGYEKAAETKDDKKESTIYLKRKDDAIISEMVVYAGEDDIFIIVMKGAFPVAELKGMAVRNL